jgi:hypothetical protein
MMDSNADVNGLPRAISFPYLHDPNLVRKVFPCEKREAVWVEWRTLMTLAMKDSSVPWGPESEAAGRRLAALLDMPIRYRGTILAQTYGFADPPAWGDAAVYLRELAECKYFVSVGGRIGAGQGIGEAAAAGCICVGQADRAYHKLICHPACLCADMGEMYERLTAVVESPKLQAEVTARQDQNLAKHFRNEPLAMLSRAIELKKQSLPGTKHVRL